METARCKAFLESAQKGSFSKAAKELNYTPSGVSQLVSAFEKELGFTLLHRNQKGVTITENGKKILPMVREFLKQEEHIYALAAEMNGLMIGNIKIAAYSSIATHWLPSVIKQFQIDYPQIKIELMEGIRQEVIKWLDNQKADLGFMSFQEPMNYDWIPLKEDPMLAILPTNHPLASSSFYPLSNCAYDKMIMPALGQDDDVIALFQKYHIHPNIQFTTLENFAAMAMVEQGLGISIMNQLITEKRICNIIKLPLEPSSFITLGIACPSFYALSPAAKKFLQYCKKYIS